MTTRVLLIACMALAACVRPETAKTDSTAAALPAVDTVKPATDSLALRDSLAARGGTTAAVTKTKTGSKTATKRDSLRLRDSVTPFDTSRKSLPPAKRP